MANAAGDWDKAFELTVDLNLTGVTMTPIGNDTAPFTGSFDGARHTIANFSLSGPHANSVGLFGAVGHPGNIRNLGLINPNVVGREDVGALAGRLDNGTITACYAQGGAVTGTLSVGGLVGTNHGGIENCYANVKVTSLNVLDIYWTDSSKAASISRYDLLEEKRDSLVSSLGTPEGIALDTAAGKMYWTDLATNKIQRANLDGSNVEDLVTGGLAEPRGIALDTAVGKMYWSDFGNHQIMRAKIDGGSNAT